MAAISNSVVHLTMRFGAIALSTGTGVLYKRGEKHFIVTAWHNVTGRHPETMECLSDTLAVPDNIVATIAISYSGHFSNRMALVLPLLGEEKALFYIHQKNWPRVDVVAIPFDPTVDHIMEHWSEGEIQKKVSFRPQHVVEKGLSTEINPVQKFLVPDEDLARKWLETVEVTEELFIPGYPQNIQDYYAQPVWKRATIASSVQSGWNREPKFLVDSASKSGMSGSPVFYYSPNGEVRVNGGTYRFNQDVAILAGIYVGRMGVTKESDPQIGTVWHQSVIDQIIDGKCFERLPTEITASTSEVEIAAIQAISSCSRKGLQNINNHKSPSRFYVQIKVLEKMNGRTSPKQALEVLLDMAKIYDGTLVPDKDN